MPTTPESSEALNDAADTPETAPLVELEIGRIAHGGHCVARYEGRVVFVRHTLPGETVRARLTDSGETSKFWRADAVEIFRIPALNVVKISFPRPVTQASLRDRDVHQGQQHVPLASLAVPARLLPPLAPVAADA